MNQRNHKLVYEDLDKRARQIVLAFFMFLGFTYAILKISYDGFSECLIRGLVLSCVAIPVAHLHYSSPYKY
jgi:hypothetical protein